MLLIVGQAADDCELDVLASWSVPVQRHGNLGALQLLTELFQAILVCLTMATAAAPGPAAPAGKLITSRTWLPFTGFVTLVRQQPIGL
jgi:hypothetical protein